MRSSNVISLEAALVGCLFLACALFSVVYAFVDNSSGSETLVDLGKNLKLFFMGLVACAVLINVLQQIFGN